MADPSLGDMLRPVEVSLARRTAVIRPQSFRISADQLDVIVVDPPEPEVVAMSAGDIIDIGGKLIELAGKIFGGGGGAGGGRQKCTQKITSTTSPDGTITTTIETTCVPV